MPKPCGHETRAAGCRVCELAATRPDYRRLWGLVGPPEGPAAPARRISPCRHRGPDLTGPERAAAGLGHGRRWLRCLHPAAPLGSHVCQCKGCGPTCPGYTPEPA